MRHTIRRVAPAIRRASGSMTGATQRIDARDVQRRKDRRAARSKAAVERILSFPW